MNTDIQITLAKSSTENEIKTYFQKVLELKQSSSEFPVNLDEVWPLVYGRKSDAVEALTREFIEHIDYQVLRRNPQNLSGGRALTSEFIEHIDYQFLRRNPENLSGGRPVDSYFLSVSCMEYFIARKVRPVFEIYRQVFHKAAEQKPLTPAEHLLQQAQLMVAQEKRLSQVESKLHVLEARTEFCQFYLSVIKDNLKLQPPMSNAIRRNLRGSMGEYFLDWAQVFFHPQSGNCNRLLPRKEVFDDFGKSSGKLNWTANRFLKALTAYCQYDKNILSLNPGELIGPNGRILKLYNGKTTEMLYVQTKPELNIDLEYSDAPEGSAERSEHTVQVGDRPAPATTRKETVY